MFTYMENIINKINVIGKIKFKKENFKFLHMDKNKWIHAVHVKKYCFSSDRYAKAIATK